MKMIDSLPISEPPLQKRKLTPPHLITMNGLAVGARLIESHNPLDIAVFHAAQTARVAKGIEDIDPEHPDSVIDLKKYAQDIRFIPLPDHNSSLRYVIVDTTLHPLFPSQKLQESLAVTGSNAPTVKEKPAITEGFSLGNVTFFAEDTNRLKHINIDHHMDNNGVIAPISISEASQNIIQAMQKDDVLNVEISYYNMDGLYEQFPHLEPMRGEDGKVLLTAYQQGIYLAICDFLQKAQVAGYPPEKVFVTGYVSPGVPSSIKVLDHLGFQEIGMVNEYSDDYAHPRRFFVLGGEQWGRFKQVYTDVIQPKSLEKQKDDQLFFESIENAPLGISIEYRKERFTTLIDADPNNEDHVRALQIMDPASLEADGMINPTSGKREFFSGDEFVEWINCRSVDRLWLIQDEKQRFIGFVNHYEDEHASWVRQQGGIQDDASITELSSFILPDYRQEGDSTQENQAILQTIRLLFGSEEHPVDAITVYVTHDDKNLLDPMDTVFASEFGFQPIGFLRYSEDEVVDSTCFLLKKDDFVHLHTE